MDDLAAFFAARLDEIEAAAKAATPGPWEFEGDDPTDDELYSTADERFATVAWTRDRAVANGQHMALHDPPSTLRDIAADRALLAALEQARKFSDHMFGSPSPEGIASGEVLHERTRAATQVLTLEHVIKIRAARFSGHPGYRVGEWAP